MSAWGRESAPLFHVAGMLPGAVNRMHIDRGKQVKESIEVIDYESLSRDKFRAVFSDYTNKGRSFRIVNVSRGNRSDCVADIKRALTAGGKQYRIRLNGPDGDILAEWRSRHDSYCSAMVGNIRG